MQSVLASEQKVFKMMEHIDNAITEADKFESRLDSYEDILGHVKETMEKIGGKNAMIEIANNNNIKLMKELNKVIVRVLLNCIVFVLISITCRANWICRTVNNRHWTNLT